MNRSFTVLCLALLAGACEPAPPDVGTVATTLDSSGTFPVLRISGVAPTWTAERIAVIGAGPEGGSEFGSVRSVLLDSRGSAYVLDASNAQVSVYDESGAFRRNLGRRGSGPGEYRIPYSIARLGDSIAIFDPGLSRISLLAPDGTWLREWTTSPNTGPQRVRLYRTPPASFWAYATTPGRTGLDAIFVRYDTTGPTDTLLIPKSSVGARLTIHCNSPDGSFSFYEQPFGSALIAVPTPMGERAVALSASYRISFLGGTGDTLRAWERDMPPPRVSDADWARATEEWQDFRRKIPRAHCNKEAFERPTERPVLGTIFFDDLQRMWVEVFTEAGQQYDIYDQTGTLLGTVVGLPATSGIEPSVAAGRIAIVVPDSLGEEVVHLFRVRAAQR